MSKARVYACLTIAVAAVWWQSYARGQSPVAKSSESQTSSMTAGKTDSQICSLIGFIDGSQAHQDCVAELARRASSGSGRTQRNTVESFSPKASGATQQAMATTGDLTLTPGSRVYIETSQNATELDRILSGSVAAVQAVDSSVSVPSEAVEPKQPLTAMAIASPDTSNPRSGQTGVMTVKSSQSSEVLSSSASGDVPGVATEPVALVKPQAQPVVKPAIRGPLKIDGLKQQQALWPVDQKPSNIFGAKGPDGSAWRGLVFKAAKDAPVRAISDGEVIFAQPLKNYGNLIVVNHGKNYMSVYAYNSHLTKHVGDMVSAGEQIASVGNTGPLADMALYFEIRKDNAVLNPTLYLRGR